MAVSAISFISCNDKEESCNSKIEVFKMQHEDYNNLTRKEWLSLPDSTKYLAYLTMSPSAKYNFWIDKLTETKNAEDWNTAESAHINKVLKFIESNNSIFNDDFMNNSNNYKKVNDFLADWIEYASNNLGWAFVVQYGVIGTGLPFVDVINCNFGDRDRGQGGFYYCDCRTKKFGWCTLIGKKCSPSSIENGKCWDTKTGCGPLWLYGCDGYCIKKIRRSNYEKLKRTLLGLSIMLMAMPAFSQNPKFMSRDEFLKISDEGLMRKTFSELSGENRYQIWTARFDELLKLNFTAKEKEHIKSMKTYLIENKDGLYIKRKEKALTKFETFMGEWSKYAKDQLGWNVFLYIILLKIWGI